MSTVTVKEMMAMPKEKIVSFTRSLISGNGQIYWAMRLRGGMKCQCLLVSEFFEKLDTFWDFLSVIINF